MLEWSHLEHKLRPNRLRKLNHDKATVSLQSIGSLAVCRLLMVYICQEKSAA